MIEFKKISIQNFLSIGNSPIEILLDKSPTTLISGKNGSGKSILITDSLSFVLYGKPYRKINIPQLINSINRKNCLVVVEFKKGNNEFKIERGLAPKIFNIYKNDTLINQDASSKDYQSVLEKNILGMSFKSFTQIIILSTSTFIPFMQLSCAERRNIIEDILDIQIFSKMNQLLKEKYSKEKDIKKELHSEGLLLDQQISMNKKYLEQYTKQHHDSSESLKQKITELEEKNKLIEKNKKDILNKNLLLRNELENIQNKRFKEKQEIYSRKISGYQHDIKAIEKENLFFHDANTCPTCSQHIDEAFKKEKIISNDSQIEQYSEELVKLQQLQEKINTICDKENSIQQSIFENENQVKLLENEININNKTINEYLNQIVKAKNYNKESIKTTIDDIKQAQENLGILEERKATNLKNVSQYEITLEILKDSGIKAKIIKQYIPVINKLINHYLKEMEFGVQFYLNEEFEETIKSPYLDRFSYASFSEGEKARIDLALLFTWREISRIRNSASSNILILDEVFDGSLDEEARDSLLKILGTLKKSNVFVISHHETLFDKFHSYIRVSKQNGFTKISA